MLVVAVFTFCLSYSAVGAGEQRAHRIQRTGHAVRERHARRNACREHGKRQRAAVRGHSGSAAQGVYDGDKADHAGEEDADIGKRCEQSGGGVQDGERGSDGTGSRIGVATPPQLYPYCRQSGGAETVIFQKIR